MLVTLAWLLGLSLAINGVLFLVAYRLQSDKLTDASYAISFISLVMANFVTADKTTYTVIGLVMVCLWAIRIGSFLLYRVMRAGKDSRFDGIRNSFGKFGKFWLGQAIAAWLLMLPITLVFRADMGWEPIVFIGIGVWLAGVLIESIADAQKYRFSQNTDNKNKWIGSGLWKYSRHPNYFGEILVWIGVFLYAAPYLSAPEILLAALSPVGISLLLLFVSGIPVLERSADKRWGTLAAYKRYKQQTSILVPLPKK